jgi:DNA (cytosine-5)-methyltransferase 1
MSWLISKALMNSLYSQEQVAAFSEDTSLDGKQSVQLSGNNIPQAYCAPDKMTGFSRLSRFGMTYAVLMESRGEELLTLYRAGFHAKTFQPLEKAQELTESDQVCGDKWRGSFTKYSQDSCSWKTHQCSLLGDLDEFLETWPQWGLMRDGECWEQQTLAQTIRGTGFGLSPNNETFFHTPCTTGLDGGSNSRKALKKRLLPTPDASQRGPTKDYNPQAKSQSGRTLQSFAAKFPTPTTMDTITRSRESYLRVQNRPKQGKNLTKLADIIHWPTPQASDNRDRGNMSNPSVQRRVAIGKQISLSQSVHPTSGQLNPTWVEWLMGWPLEWTDLKPLEMDKSLSAQQQHGDS